MITAPIAHYIGNPTIGNAVMSIKSEWNWTEMSVSITDFMNKLRNNVLSNDIDVIFILDSFFDKTGENKEFEQFVSALAPYCLFMIVNYYPENKDLMRDAIDRASYEAGSDVDGKYYFISKNNPVQEIDQSINDFVNKSELKELVAKLLGRDVVREEPKMNDLTEETNPEPGESEYLGRVVVSTSSKGGSGKSTVAMALATYLAHSSINSVREGLEEKPLKVCILDLDVRDGQVGFLTGESSPTVMGLVNDLSPEKIKDIAIHSERLKVDLLLAPKRPRHAEQIPPDFFVDLIRELKKMYDYIIIDTSVNYIDPLLDQVAYPIADQIVFITDIVVTSIFSMTRWLKEVTAEKSRGGSGISQQKIGIVVNKALHGVNMDGNKIAKAALGRPVISVIPSSPKLIAHATNIQSLNVIILNNDIKLAIRRIARGVAQNYKLSDNIEP